MTEDQKAEAVALPDGAKLLPDGSATLQLRYPISGTARIDTLRIRRPFVGAIRAMEAAVEADKHIVLASKLTGLSVDKLDELDADDYRRLQEAAAFVASQGNSQPTG